MFFFRNNSASFEIFFKIREIRILPMEENYDFFVQIFLRI